MSGIAGLIRLDGGPLEPGLIEAMTGAMAHRGPDGAGAWSRGSVALGQCMLRTTPESLEETQPLANEDESVVLVMDGRIDNWEELRAELLAQGARLRSRADAELVLRAYETWGRDCVQRMDGDFALAIWDARRREAFCARDRMGHKPLHYHWDGKRLAIASELHAILALPWVAEEINEGLVAEHLANALCSLDETLWKGILRLPPAHRMAMDAGGSRIERYWAPDFSELRYKREEEYVEHYRALLEDRVRRQSRAQGPLACEVSGGLDSSAVFAVAETLRRRGELLAPGSDAYTLRFEGGAAGRDLSYARAVGAHLARPVYEIAPSTPPLDWYRDWTRRYRELPSRPNGTMQLGIYQTALGRGSRVILGGDGGDQWLTGEHSYYAASLAAGRLGEFLECLGRDARTHGLSRSLYLAARHGAGPLLPYRARQLLRRALARARGAVETDADWLARPLAEALAQRRRCGPRAEHERQAAPHRQKLRLLLGGDIIHDTEAMERSATSQGLELRSPLDSAAVAQFGFSVPRHWLLRAGWDRYIHRRSLAAILPEAVAWRRGKAEFSAVYAPHRTELHETLTRAVEASPDPWVAPEGLARLLSGADADRPKTLMRLWTLFACDAVARAGTLTDRTDDRLRSA